MPCSRQEQLPFDHFSAQLQALHRAKSNLHLDVAQLWLQVSISLFKAAEADVSTEIFSPESLLSNKSGLEHWTGNLNENVTERKKHPKTSPLFCMKYFLWLLKKHLFTERAVIAKH